MAGRQTVVTPVDQLLTGASARVHGDGATADILSRHLRGLGAEVVTGGPAPSGSAAEAVIELTGGTRREIGVSWSGPVSEPGLTGELPVQAVCGVMHVNGRRRGAPRALAVDYCSTAAGVLAMTGFLASLHSDADSVRVETSVAEAALLSASQYLAGAGAEDPEAVDLSPGGPPFVSADGVRFEIETLQPEPWGGFWKALDVDPAAIRASWRPFQFRYATATAPLPSELHQATRAQSFAAISDVAARTGMHVCRLHSPSPPSAGNPWQLRETGGTPRQNPASTPHRPLASHLVLEAGRRIQAPLTAHLLRLLGADVTRIEPPGGDPLRGMPPCTGGISARWLALNRGKDAVELDIKSATDRERLRALAADADVFLHNWAPGKAEELGLAATDFDGGLVHAYTSGWGGSTEADLPPGTDFMVQARTGLAELVGPESEPPSPSLMTLLDVLGGLLGAETVVAALLARRRLGSGIAAESSLFGAAETLRAAPVSPRRAPAVEVTDDLAALLTDPRLTAVLGRDELGCPALSTPWRFS
ncbi:CoA transferase [Amycolatopsis azurea]|uniref:CoA transferase n=1 Tax=Amycolatopsis azurea TaxID=36819 RepID=UPI003807CA87